MSQEAITKPTPSANQNTEEYNFMDMFYVALSYWRWYVISVITCVILAFLYVKTQQNVYQRETTVLIKADENAQSSLYSESEAFADLGLTGFAKKIDNELLVFQTKRLMIETARRLHLDVAYYGKGQFRNYTLYGETPVTLTFLDAKENDFGLSLIMTPGKDGMVTLHDFAKDDKKYNKEITAKAGTTVKTPIGRIQVETNESEDAQSLKGVDIHVEKSSLKEVGNYYNKMLQVSAATKGASIISLIIKDTSKKRAENILDTLVAVYNEDAIEDKNKVVVNTDNFINDRLITLEDELGSVDMTIARFKSSNQLTDIASDASAFRSSYNSYDSQVADLQSKRSVGQYILDYIRSIESRGEGRYEVIPNNAGLGNAAVEGLVSEYNTLTLQREKLQLDAGSNNPQVLDLGNTIDRLRTRIVSSLHNYIKSLDIQIGNANSRVGTASSRITAVPGQQKTVTNVERQQRIKENLYMYLLNKREANNLKRNMTEANARVLDPANGSEFPISPRKAMIMLIGLIAGLAIPSAFLYLLVIANTKVRSRKDLKNLSITFVGEIPEVEETGIKFFRLLKKVFGKKKKHRKERRIVVAKDSHDPVSEAVRILRTNLQMMQAGDKSKKVIQLTSYIPSSGKTFVTSNLGMSLALAGKKVILVDLDIRRASLSSSVGKNLPGITNYLGGYTDDFESLIVHSKQSENLDVLPAGVSAPNPAELLMLPALDKLIEKLKERYDYVILDTVPFAAIADAVIVNRLADITMFIIRAGNLDRRMLPEVEALQTEGKLKNLCVTLNGVSKAHLYTSYYGYGYHKYYGYGY